jgi:O-methyltransferase
LYFLVASVEALEENGVPGAIAELGVYKGSSAKIIHHLAPDRDLYLFDTFDGFPESHARRDPGAIAAGGYAYGFDEVRRFIGDHPNIRYCKGTFPETATMAPADVKFAMVHLDCDLYVPTKAALEFFYPRLVPGGLLILHDYYSGCWPGVPRAVDEFLADKPEGLIRIPDKSGTAALTKLRGNFDEPKKENPMALE